VRQKVGHCVGLGYIFQTTETVYVFLGKIQHDSDQNTSVKSILNKVITQVALPGDNQARPLHSIAHFLKIPTPICIFIGTVKRRDILNMLFNNSFRLPVLMVNMLR